MALWFREENLPNRLRLCLGDETITCWSKGILWKLKRVGMALLFLHFFTYMKENSCDCIETFFFTKLTARFVDILNGHPYVMAFWAGMTAWITHQCDAGSVLGLVISKSGTEPGSHRWVMRALLPASSLIPTFRAQWPLMITRRKHTLALNWCNASFGSPVNISG